MEKSVISTASTTKNKRFRTAQTVTNRLADIISFSTGEVYHQRLAQLKDLINSWAAGTEVVIEESTNNEGKSVYHCYLWLDWIFLDFFLKFLLFDSSDQTIFFAKDIVLYSDNFDLHF